MILLFFFYFIKDKIDLTIATCEFNMNYKVQLFPYFSGFPDYMGFADDAIEYAYDDALNDLFATKFKKIGTSPLANVNISSIIIRRDCDDEMFEIVKQTIMAGTDHIVLTKEDLERMLGVTRATNLTNGNLDKAVGHFRRYEKNFFKSRWKGYFKFSN